MIEVCKQTNILHNLCHTTKILGNYNYIVLGNYYVVLYLFLVDHWIIVVVIYNENIMNLWLLINFYKVLLSNEMKASILNKNDKLK